MSDSAQPVNESQGTGLIAPHGGVLVDRRVPDGKADALRSDAGSLPRIPIDARSLADLEMIAVGGFSPLTGFLGEADYGAVLERMRLADGTVWPIPIVLAVDGDVSMRLQAGRSAALVHDGEIVGVIDVEEMFRPDRERELHKVYGTGDADHPGVAAVRSRKEWLVGGPIQTLRLPAHDDFPAHNLSPRETRRAFRERGWRTVVGFQTRNPIHRAHEYVTKTALETVDGLLIHPIVGATKGDDVPVRVRMECYEVLIRNYYAPSRVLLAINPSNMFYAGPREAVLHAIVRQNYGCTHFIVGRDHAGVEDYYDPREAQELVRRFSESDLGVTPLFFEDAFWCRRTGGMATAKTSPSAPEERLAVSGSRIRAMLAAGETPPAEMTRPEVAEVLLRSRT